MTIWGIPSSALMRMARKTMDEKRPEAYPNIKTFKEQGFNITYYTWRGLALPKGVDPQIKQILVDAFTKAEQDPDFVAKAKSLNLNLAYLNPTDFAAFLKSNFEDVTKTMVVFCHSILLETHSPSHRCAKRTLCCSYEPSPMEFSIACSVLYCCCERQCKIKLHVKLLTKQKLVNNNFFLCGSIGKGRWIEKSRTEVRWNKPSMYGGWLRM